MRQEDFLKIIEAGDRGSVAHPAITENFEILDDHNHNGINSEKISASSIAKGTIYIQPVNWVFDGTDYAQTLTLPGGYEYDTTIMKFVITSGVDLGKEVMIRHEKVTINTFKIYCSFNDFSMHAVLV